MTLNIKHRRNNKLKVTNCSSKMAVTRAQWRWCIVQFARIAHKTRAANSSKTLNVTVNAGQ